MANANLTQELLQSLFEYRDGDLYWRRKANTNGLVNAGARAGYVRSDGRVQIRIAGKLYYSYRLIFLYHFGELPAEVDHIDCNPANNRIENLRAATRPQNEINCGLRSDNKTGMKGVYKAENRRKFTAQLNGKHLGSFNTKTEAAKAYNGEAVKQYGEYAWLNPV